MSDTDWNREPETGAEPPMPDGPGSSPAPKEPETGIENPMQDRPAGEEPASEPAVEAETDAPTEETLSDLLPDSGAPLEGAEIGPVQEAAPPYRAEMNMEPVQSEDRRPDAVPMAEEMVGEPVEQPAQQENTAQSETQYPPVNPEYAWPQPEFSKGPEPPDAAGPHNNRDISSGAPGQENPAQPPVAPPNRQGQNPLPQGYGAQPYTNPYQQYGQYQNPYINYPNQPYGQQPYNGQYQNPQQPYPQQYWSYQQQPGQQAGGGMPPQPPQEMQPGQEPERPRKMNGGLKAFLWILGTLAALFVVAFCVVSINTAVRQMENKGEGAPDGNGPSYSEPAPDNGTAPDKNQPEMPQNDATDPNNAGMEIEPCPSGEGMSAKEVYREVVESVVGVETSADDETGLVSQGSGIVATKSGYIITNAHVVEYSKDNKVSVLLHNDETKYSAVVVGYDKTSDLAILKIDAKNLKPAVFGDVDEMEIGDEVLAIGNPGGMDFASTLTGGYISALNRTLKSNSDNGMTYIQTDAAINPGNSGGPLVNMYGQVIGINSNKIISTGYEGMGFAIPVSHAKSIIDDLISRGYVSGRARLGITAKNVAGMQAQLSGLPSGVAIVGIDPESSFSQVGAQVGDVITKADGEAIESMNDLYTVLNRHKPGDEIIVTLYQPSQNGGSGQSRDVKVTLLEDKGETQKTVSQPTE